MGRFSHSTKALIIDTTSVDDEPSPEPEFHAYRREEAERQVERLRKVKRERDGAKVASALEGVRAAAKDGKNVMPSVIVAVKAYATVGEVCGALVEVFGRYVEPVRF